MNPKQLFGITLVSCALLGLSSALGTFSTVTLNGALTIPLLAATAGSLATPLAVLGVLKLGAAALFLLGSLKKPEEEEYGYQESSGYSQPSSGYGFKRRHTRAAEEAGIVADPEAIYDLIAAMDTYGCGKQLVCELQAQSPEELAADEKLMLSLFGGKVDQINVKSSKAEFEIAAKLGMASKNQLLCRAKYANCPYTGDEMMDALRASNL